MQIAGLDPDADRDRARARTARLVEDLVTPGVAAGEG